MSVPGFWIEIVDGHVMSRVLITVKNVPDGPEDKG